MDFSSNLILLVIIFVYLVYSFIKTRKKQEKKPIAPKEAIITEQPTDYEKPVVAAIIAAIMGDNKYIVKSIYPTGQVNEKKSFWKVSGRQESMNTRLFFRKK